MWHKERLIRSTDSTSYVCVRTCQTIRRDILSCRNPFILLGACYYYRIAAKPGQPRRWRRSKRRDPIKAKVRAEQGPGLARLHTAHESTSYSAHVGYLQVIGWSGACSHGSGRRDGLDIAAAGEDLRRRGGEARAELLFPFPSGWPAGWLAGDWFASSAVFGASGTGRWLMNMSMPCQR